MEPEQQNSMLSLHTPGNPGESKYHTPRQRRTLKELQDLKQRGKLNPKEDAESQKDFLQLFG